MHNEYTTDQLISTPLSPYRDIFLEKVHLDLVTILIVWAEPNFQSAYVPKKPGTLGHAIPGVDLSLAGR
jgi:hypothetical protein